MDKCAYERGVELDGHPGNRPITHRWKASMADYVSTPSLDDARHNIEEWRRFYNEVCPTLHCSRRHRRKLHVRQGSASIGAVLPTGRAYFARLVAYSINVSMSLSGTRGD